VEFGIIIAKINKTATHANSPRKPLCLQWGGIAVPFLLIFNFDVSSK